jgi:DNA-binding LytR/AlgR family response regulator
VHKKWLSSKNEHTFRESDSLSGSLTISIDNRTIEIPHKDISHITVEDHYSRIYFQKENTMQNLFIRASLKSLQQSLPEDPFLQIHRSHLVNIRYVCGLSKNKREVKIRCAQDEATLPISRHRLSDLRISLMACPFDQSSRQS